MYAKLKGHQDLLGENNRLLTEGTDSLRTFARKSSTRQIFFKLMPRSDNELLMSEMQTNGVTELI